jgi:aminopeptidase N
MDEPKWLAGAWKNPHLLFIGLGSSLVLLMTIGNLVRPPYSQLVGHIYLSRQAAALQPAFRADLETLDEAPRYTLIGTVDPERGNVTGQMTVHYTNRTETALSELVFRLYPNAWTIYGGGSLTVERVAQDKVELEIELSEDRTVLHVPLQHPLAQGEAVSLDLSFTAQTPSQSSQGYGIFNRAQGVLTLAGWYPVLALYDSDWQTPSIPLVGDALLAEISLYEVTLTVPSGYDVVSTGILVGQQGDEEQVTWHLVSGPAREFAAAISNRFEEYETKVGAVTIHLRTLPADNPAVTAEEALQMASEAFKAYSDRFGVYPYTELDVVEAVVSIGGYEFPGMVYVQAAKRIWGTSDNYQYLVAHEVAHQWWYGLVGNDFVEEPWLDESLATYATVIYLEHAEDMQAGENLVGYWRRTYGSRELQEPPVNSSTLDFRDWGAYRQAVYIHGALFLDQLRQELGDEEFFELLQRQQTKHRYKMATTAEFLHLAEEVAGRDLNLIFKDWFETDATEGRGGEGQEPNSSLFEQHPPQSLHE